MTEKLSGAYIELYKVADPSGTPVETLLGVTKDDVEISMNPEVRETSIHNERRKTKKATHDAPVISFGGQVVSSLGALSTLGLENGSQELEGFVAGGLEALEIRVYENAGDTTPKQTFQALTVEIVLNSISWPTEDFASWSGEAHVNGSITRS